MLDPNGSNEQITGPVMKRLREALGLSQERFARLIGCSAKKISRSESGSEITFTIPEIKNLDLLLKEHFGVDIHALPDDTQNGDLPFLH
ncbi:XRE family transcriptional regulator [Leptolyngbyaceae cyanobacterium CCMR0081]|uniref:XRE family transcriptional regulator n=2 Tax=Adonisia TaxID=2950183 RepID=A0A6M0RVF4_9CYAN|nr:XRE family transcriptional regulator [Adonisia turfae CCMR0081]